MASTFTTNKSIEKPAAGSYNDTWATPVNADWDDIDNALAGHTVIDVTGIAAGVITLALEQYQPPNIIFTGALTASLVYALPPGIGWLGTIFNNTSGAFSLVFASGSTSSIALPQGKRTAIVCDGVNIQPQQSATNEGPPTAKVGLVAIDGGAGTIMDSASAPALDQSIEPTWTGIHAFEAEVLLNGNVSLNSSMIMEPASTLDGRVGTVEVFTLPPSDASNLAASTNFVHSVLVPYALLDSPDFIGTPTAPTRALADSTTDLATTQFVNPGSSLGPTGYRINPDGSIEMWGESAPAGGSNVTVTFPTISGHSNPGFPTACWNIQVTAIGVFSDSHTSQPSASQQNFILFYGAAGTQFSWRAIGN